MPLDAHDARNMNRVLRHRLRNMASGIRSATTLLSQELAGRLTPEETEYFPLILDVCDQINEITNRLNLLFDDLPAGGTGALEPILRDAVEALHRRIPTAQVCANVEPSAAGARVGADQLVQIALREVLINAAEAAPGKTIEVRCRESRGELVLEVLDQGPGVAAPELENIFRPFFTTRERHLGVGLAIRFSVISMPGPEHRDHAETNGLTPMRILIVEDDDLLRTSMTARLRKWGHDAEACDCLAEAGDSLDREAFDLVLSDMRLPDGDGLDFLDQRKKAASETTTWPSRSKRSSSPRSCATSPRSGSSRAASLRSASSRPARTRTFTPSMK